MTDAVLVENLATMQQAGWVFIAIPKRDMPATPCGVLVYEDSTRKLTFPWVTDGFGHGIRAYVTLPANTKAKMAVVETEDKPRDFAWHPAVQSNIQAIAPSFCIAGEEMTAPELNVMHADSAVVIARLRSHDPSRKITVDCWVTVQAAHPTMEFCCQAVYGTTANDGQAQALDLPAVTMHTAAQIHVDFARRNGHELPYFAQGEWNAVIAPAGRWHRAVRYEIRGALLTLPDAARLEGRPMQGLYVGWDGAWLGLGKIPQRTGELAGVRQQQRSAYLNPAPGLYSDARPRCQPRESGTTGEQPDFGVASDLAVVTMEPWEIHDALWQCQSYAQRPTANKEADGWTMRAELHPNAELHNQRPDLSYGQADRLGWPGLNQIGWIPSPATTLWTTSDDQHRADNLLHAAYLLTRDPALEQLIRDQIELDKLDIYVKRNWVPAPRAVGRMALTRANQIALGFPVSELAIKQAREALRQSPYGSLPITAPVRTLGGRDQAKYGWTDANGQAVIGWQGWQETIAVIGLLALWRQTDALDVGVAAKTLAKVVTYNCWQVGLDGLRHAYAIAWNGGESFAPGAWPQSYNQHGEGWTSFVYVSGACSTWTIASADAIAAEDINARAIASMMRPPQTITEARWRAL